ncbi:hypothetical protein Plhal703r1_c01g0001221 [Plasmopara halstedii]
MGNEWKRSKKYQAAFDEVWKRPRKAPVIARRSLEAVSCSLRCKQLCYRDAVMRHDAEG